MIYSILNDIWVFTLYYYFIKILYFLKFLFGVVKTPRMSTCIYRIRCSARIRICSQSTDSMCMYVYIIVLTKRIIQYTTHVFVAHTHTFILIHSYIMYSKYST